MIRKMTDRAWCSNQYGDFPLLGAALWFFIFGRVFGVWLFPRVGFVAFFFCLSRCFNGNFRFVRQTVSSLGNDALAFFQSLSDLDLIVLAYSHLDRLLMSVLVVPNHHDGGSAVGTSEQRGGRYH